MPFIEGEKLAKLYKQVDNERNASIYFRDLYKAVKKKMVYSKIYTFGFYILLPIAAVFVIFFLNDASRIEQNIKEPSSEVIDTILKVEEKSDLINVQALLENVRVYSLQITAITDKSWLLFSENFVNFRVHKVGELNAYSTGSFATEDEANVFRDKIIDSEIKDAWGLLMKTTNV